MKKENLKFRFNFLRIPVTLLLLVVFVNNFNVPPITDLGKIKIEEKIVVEEKIEVVKLTPVNVWKKIIEYEIEQPKIVFSQIMLETGQLKSEGALIDNNLFGFFIKGKYHIFENWEKSIEYYKIWQDRKYNGGNYYNFLEKVGYAKDSLYISKLVYMQGKLFKNKIYE